MKLFGTSVLVAMVIAVAGCGSSKPHQPPPNMDLVCQEFGVGHVKSYVSTRSGVWTVKCDRGVPFQVDSK